MKFVEELRHLDRHDVAGWPLHIKRFFVGLVFVLIVFFGWYLYISDKQDELAASRAHELQLKDEFAQKQRSAANLEALRAQLQQMQVLLKQLLRQLPGKTEMPELLTDISQSAQSAGLGVESFQPGPEAIKDFYAELPIQLQMIGSYHQFGTFISSVASLHRVVILTMHDVSLTPVGKGPAAGNGQLMLQGTVTTYRYVDDSERGRGPVGPRSKR
ncbi:type IV pilus inner membrane component PilO [Frateuria aurantia]